MKLKSLLKHLQGKKNIAIFTHDNPDPDCIASAFIFKCIAKHLQVGAKIFYGGYLTRSENKAMANLLAIELKPVEAFDASKFDGYAIVDTQKDTGNNSFPADLIPTFTFDHHAVPVPHYNFYDIDIKAGATSTILLGYFFKLGLTINQKIATSYCYALMSETKDLDRGATGKDIRYFNALYPQANVHALSKMRHAKKSPMYFKTLKKALNRYQIREQVLTCFLGEVANKDYVSEIADVFIRMEGIEYSLVIGKCEGSYVVSSRTSKEDINLGAILHQVVKKYGKAGGHSMIAAGQFQADPEIIIKSFLASV